MAEAEAEDEEELAQWMPICDDCDNPVEHYCTTCGDKLCTGCKDHHLSSKRYRGHQVVPYSAGMRAAQKSTSTCSKHPGERYTLFCKPCQLPVCAFCVTQAHADHNHTFLSISDAFAAAKDQATSSLKRLTRDIRPRVTEYSDKLKSMATEALRAVEVSEEALKTTAQRLHEVVDLTLEESLKQVAELKEKKILPKLQKQERCRVDINKKVEESIKQYEDNLRSEDPIVLLLFMKGKDPGSLDTAFTIPTIEAIPLMALNPVPVSKEAIQTFFGSVSLSDKQIVVKQDEKAKEKKKEEFREKKDGEGKQNQQTKMSSTPFRSIMKNPEKQTVFTLNSNIGYLAKLRHFDGDKLWLLGENGTSVLVNNDGNVLHTVKTGCKISMLSGICISRDKELIFVDTDKGQVKKVSQDFRVTTLFTTKKNTFGISQLQSGDWVVCMGGEGVLRVYDGIGNVVREIGKGHLRWPYYVTLNKVNDDICVSDNDKQVVVFSSSGEKRFTYTGDGTGFVPFDLCCDRLGNILITDYNKHRVHIIDRDGHFLQYLVSGKKNISYPITIDIDDKGYAWVGEYSTRVKAYKYLQ